MNRSSNITLQEKYIVADAKEGLQLIPDKTVDTCITSPPTFDGRKETFNKGSGKYAGAAIVPGNSPQTQHMAGRAHERWRMKDGVHVRNKRDVWTVSTKPYRGAHFATFPPELIRPCILAGSRPGGIVLDPFFGSGTTGSSKGRRPRIHRH
jgi:DNA modification methylase